MPRSRRLSTLFTSALVPGMALICLLAITGYAFLGPTGFLAWGEYRARLEKQREVLNELAEERSALRNRVALIEGQSDDGDLKGEMIRRELGVAAPDEIVVPLR